MWAALVLLKLSKSAFTIGFSIMRGSVVQGLDGYLSGEGDVH
jgi:hypothetical protein